jgi:hypothetical protein
MWMKYLGFAWSRRTKRTFCNAKHEGAEAVVKERKVFVGD